MALQLKEVLFVHRFNLISLKGMSLASSKHRVKEGKWPDSYLKIDRKKWLEKLSDDKLIRQQKFDCPEAWLKCKFCLTKNPSGFPFARKRQQGGWVCVALTYTTVTLRNCSEELVNRKNIERKNERMKLRLLEPVEENSAQLCEQKDWRWRGWAEVKE